MKHFLLKTVLLLCALIAGSGTMWGQTVAVNDVLWTEPFTGTNTTNTFSATSSWGSYTNPTTFVAADKTDLTYSSANAMMNSASSTNMTDAHVWLNKSTTGYIQVTGIPLYNTTKVKVSWAQTGSGTVTVYYQFDGSGSFTSLSGCSGANENYLSSELNVSGHTTIALKFQRGNTNKNLRIDDLTLKATAVAAAAGTTAAPSISGNTPFLSNTTVTINNAASADGAAIYYTLNGDDPTTTTSATCFAYSAPFTVDATTTVKAIAKHADDENASSVTSKTFTKVTPMTVTAALTAIDALANNGTIADQCVSGIVCTEGSLSSGAITYYISADGTESNRLQVYKGKGLNNASFENASDIAVGDEVVVYGTLKNFNGTTPEFDAGSFLLSKVRKPAPTFSLDIDEATLEAYTHETADATLTTNTDGEITCVSSNADVATVALKSAGVYTITAQSEGSATITIRSAASANYQAAEATVAVTVNDSRTDAGLSYAEDEEEITWGDSFTGQDLTNTHSLAVTYSSTDETVATVNATSGVVSVLKAGSTTIKATFAGNATYKAAVASYTLTVNKAEAGISYSETSFDVELNYDSFVAPTLNNPNALEGITYASNNGTVATVNASTGALSLVTTAEGTVKITATFAGNDNYKSGSANYTITVIDPSRKGSKLNPYTVADVIDGTATGTDIYVKGFIVGEYVGKTTNPRTSSFTTDSNIAIADEFTTSPTASGSIPVQLGTDALKNAWGCKTSNGGTIRYEILVKGNVDSYFSVTGIKSTSEVTAVSIPATLGTNGYATFASPYALDLTTANLPAGVTAYKAAVDGTTVNFTEFNQTVPANTGILLKGTANETVAIPVAASGTAVANNAFEVNAAGATFTGDDLYYYFGLKKNTLTFALFDPSTIAIPANKAYLKVLKSSIPASAKSLNVVFDETTGISTLERIVIDNDAWYDLQGRRVAQPTKGIYIHNGKKIFVK